MKKPTQNDWEIPKKGLAKIIKIEIEEVPEGYIKPYISLARKKYPMKLMSFVEDMLPTQDETFTREEYPLIMFGFSKKYRQGFYIKKEYQAMFEFIFKEFMGFEYARGRADARKEVIDVVDLHIRSFRTCDADKKYIIERLEHVLATLRKETK